MGRLKGMIYDVPSRGEVEMRFSNLFCYFVTMLAIMEFRAGYTRSRRVVVEEFMVK